jgi:hypothetical protein
MGVGDGDGTGVAAGVTIGEGAGVGAGTGVGADGRSQAASRRTMSRNKTGKTTLVFLIRRLLSSCVCSRDCYILYHPNVILKTPPLFSSRRVKTDQSI